MRLGGTGKGGEKRNLRPSVEMTAQDIAHADGNFAEFACCSTEVGASDGIGLQLVELVCGSSVSHLVALRMNVFAQRDLMTWLDQPDAMPPAPR